MSALLAERTEDECLHSSGSEKIRILYLDDDYIDHKLMEFALRNKGAGPDYDLTCVFSIEDARDVVRSGTVDVLVTDNQMPSSANFHETLSRIGRIDPKTKIMVVSSEINGAVFHEMDHLERKPDAIVDKAELRRKIKLGLFENL